MIIEMTAGALAAKGFLDTFHTMWLMFSFR